MGTITRAKFRSMKYEEQMKYLKQVSGNCDSDSDEEGVLQDSDEEWNPPKKQKISKQCSRATNKRIIEEYSDVEDVYNDENIHVEWDDDANSDSELDNDEMDHEFDQTETSTKVSENVLLSNDKSKESKLYGKDKTEWNANPLSTQINAKFNSKIPLRTGPIESTKNLSIRETFDCIFNDEMRNIIVTETNRKANSIFDADNEKYPDKPPKIWKSLTIEELNAYLAVLITAGVHHSNKEHLNELWTDDSLPLYRACTGKNRFKAISRFLRFDDFNTREERLKTTKAAPIANIFNKLNENLFFHYDASMYITIDEQLYGFRGRTRFTQYMPKKPAKYGIKVWWSCDSLTGYPLVGQIYTGKSSNGREINQGERVVKDLSFKFKDTGRNIVTDNFFSTFALAKFLSEWNLTFVGTMKKNKTCIPKEMLANTSREPLSTIFGFHDNVTMCSYVPKKNKAVVLLSTLHNTKTITDDSKKKPEIIQHYNKTKGGVDLMDKMAGAFTKRKTAMAGFIFL